MYPCHCCKSAHHDIALLSHWSPSESDEEIVNEAILSELGETSVHWLNELTETYLAEHCGHDHGSLSASPNVSKGWSPFPKGGIHYIPDSTGKQMTTGDMTPLTALLSSPRQSQNDLHLKASIQAITDPSIAKDFPSSQVDLNWTIGMATPVEKFLEKNYKEENPHELGLVRARKVTHRQLFSPTGSSACDDSFSLVEDDWSEGNLTVETEKTFTSEADVSCENEVTMCEQGPNVSWASAEGSDGSEKFIPCDQSVGGTGGLGRTSEEKAEESPRSADGCDLNFSNATENRCSSLFDDSFGSAWERTSDLDLSLVRSKSEEKSVQANVSTRRQSAVLERTGNHSSSMSHIEKVLAKVFDGDGGDDSDSIKDSVKDDAVRNDTQPAAHQASVEPDCAPNIYRKRQSAETTPHSKKQKLEHVPNSRTQNQCHTEYKMDICDEVSSLDCCPTLSVGQSHGIPEPLKKKGGVISILKNSMTPKNTCKKRVQFNLDIDLGVNMSAMKGCKADAKLMASADTAGFHLTSADNLCDLVSDPEPGQDAVSSTDLSEYFFKNAGGCRSTETSCHDSDNRGKCHPCNQTTQPVTAEVDLTDYNFDSSFEASPTFSSQGCPSKTMEKVKDPQNHVGNDTFSSQGCPSKTMEKVKDPQDHVGKDIVLHQVMAPKHIAKVETVVNDETGGGSYITSQGNDCLKISRKAVVSDRIAAFCNVDACVAAAELENQPEGNVGTGRGMGCLQSEFCDIEINCDNCNHSGGTHAAKSSPYKSAPTEQALETLSADVPSSAPKPLANRISHNVEMKPTLNLGSTRPRKFRYPTADQIARSNPDRHTSEDHGFKPTLNCTVLTKPFIQESTAAYHQRAHQGEPEKSQLNSSQIVSETELQKAGGKVLGFVTFSEVYKENPESNLQVKTTCPPSMFHGSLSTKPSAECSVKLSNDTVIAPTSSSTCILRTSHTLTASPTPKNGTNKDMPRLERKPCTASSADNENPSCIPIYHQPNSLSNRLSISVNDRLWASHDLGSITASTSQDQCPTNVNNSPKTCPTSILGSPVDDYTLPSQIWASTEFSQIEEGFDLEMSVSTEGQASLGSTPVQVSEKSADLSVTFSGNENQLQNYACNNETALTSLSTLVPTSSCSPNTKYIESTSNTDLGNCYSAVKHAEATLNINLEKNCDIKQAEDTPNINPGTCSSNRKQVEATSNINRKTCSSNRKQVEATSNINLEKTLHEVLGVDDFTFCQPNPMKLTPACPTGFATASGRQLSHFAEAHANKCMDNLEDQLEFLLASKKEKVESEEGARPYAMKTDQQGKLKVKTSYPVGMFPGRDTSMGIGSRTLISVRNDNNFNSLPPVCKGSENLKFTEKHQDSEAFEVNNSMGKSFTSASERVFPSPLNSTANGLSKTNILPSNEELQLGSIMSVSFDFPQGGFSTAGGGQISLSEAARNKAKKIWDSVNQESNLKDPLIADESLTEDQVTTSANMNISEISLKAALGGVSVDERPKGFKPFKAPSLKSKNDSKHNSTSPLLGKGPDLQKRPSVELDEWGDDSILKDIITDEENLPPVHKTGEGEVIPKHFSGSPSSITSLATKAQPPLTSGFTTGSGKHVPLSKKAMQAAEKFWKEFEADAALPVPFELDTISSADLLTRHSEQANKPDRSTVDLNFKQPFESGAKLTNSCLLSSKIPKGSDISAVSKIMGPHEPLTKENSSSYSVPSKLSITGKRLWSPNEELNLNSEFSFENDVTDSNCAGTAKDTVAASHSSDIAEAASVIEYCAAVSHATLKVANDLNLLCQRDLTDTNLMCVAPGVSLSVTEIAHSPVKLDGFTSSAQDSSDKSAPKAIGFSNASGSKVTVSEKALRQAKTLFDESNDTTTTPSTPNTHELTAVNEALHKMKDRVPCNIDGGSSNKTLSFSGFTTASGTSVSVAEKAWLQARSFLEESSESEILQKDCNLLQPLTETLPVINSFTISTVDGMLLPDKTLKCGSNNCFTDPNGDSEACFNQNNLVNTFPVSCYTGGFSTASGKKVNVSKVALDRAKGVLKDTLSNSNTETPAIDTENNDAETYSRGFFTASDHKVNVSKVALDRAKGVLKDTLSNSNTETPAIDTENNDAETYSHGFSTASGHKVNVSKVALDHAKGVLKDTLSNSNTETPAIDTENNDAKTYSHGFSTASGRKVNVSKVALDHAHGVLKDAVLDTDTPARNTEKNIAKPHSSGFSTALGHKVNVSKVALDRAKGVLKDTLSNSNTETPAIDTENNDAETYSHGFSTASGHKVNVSKVALDHAKGVLKDTLSNSNTETPAIDTENNDAKTYSHGFSTASGRKVNVSKVALDHAHGVLKDAVLDTDTPARNTEKNIAKPHSSGFSTALGHKVNVSKVALDHAKGVLKDTLSNSNTETLAIDSAKTYSGGFSTASGRKVNVSKMALDHANGVLKDALLDSNAETPARDTEKNVAKAYSGSFSTALGHKVNVSKVALDHAHGVLKEASLEIESSTVAAHLSDDSALLHVKAAGLRYDLEAWPKRTRYTSTPLTDRRSKSCSLAEGGQTDPLKQSFTPVSSRCDEFLYDRPVTRSGKRLYPVKPRSLTNELCSATLVENNLNSKSSFKPPCKKAKLSSDKDLEVCPAAASGPKTNHITKGSFVPPMFKPPSATHGTKPSLSASKVTNEDLPGDSGTKEPKTSAVSKNSSNIAKADLRTSVDMEDDAENLLLCQDFETRSPASAAISKGHESQSHSNGSRSCLVTGTREAQKGQGMLGASKSQERSHPLSELVLEEEKIKQGKIIRAKKRARVRPQCGRWMEARKKKGSLQKLNDLEPATGLTREELLSLGVSVSALEITGLNAREFRFDLRRFYPALDAAVLLGDGALLVPDRCGYAGVEEFYRAFQTLDSVDPGLVDDLWVGNHFRWIVWKLAAYEVSLPHHFAGRSLTPDTVMLQLKYRYDREIDACHRSALKKIIERDETPSKRMVLCVASVVNNSDGQCMVEVTDGWYSIKAQLDDRLADLVSRKKIAPGDKIVTSGAELVGGQDACSPLEIKEGMALKLHGNSTRPAPWHSRLGFCLPPSPLCVPIKSLCSDGGHLGCVDVVISRIYPVMYMEKLKGGGCVFRTAEEEDKARQRHESKREAELEKIYSGLQNESKENLKGKRRNLKKFSKKDVEKLWDGHEIAEALDIALNPDELQLLLSQSQLNRLMEHRQRETDRHQEEMKRRLAEAMSETQEVRNVAPVLKVKVSGLSAVDVDDSVSCLVTVWRPGPEWTSMEEGQRYKLYNMPVSTVRGRSGFGKVSLTATRQTRLKPCSVNDNLLDMVFEPREVWTVSDLTSRVPIGNEFDFLGVVIQMNTSTGLSQPMLLYASDKNGEFLCIKLWSGTQMNSLKCGQIFVACNLSLSSVTSERSCLIVAEARSDLTTMTTNGHSSRYSEAFSEMQVLCKRPDFVNSLKSELDICLASHQNKPTTKSSSISLPRYDAEDFLVEIVDKIFSPMSQCPEFSVKSNMAPTTSSDVDMRRDGKCEITSEEHCGGVGTKSPEARETSSLKGRLNPCVETPASANALCSISEKRKQMLRDKMAKLLAYDQLAPLHPLPVAGSPACIKEFKSPVNKKT